MADALSAVDGVTGYPKRPSVPKAGDAWPLVGSLDHAIGSHFMVSWRVVVVLPQQGEEAAMDFFDGAYAEIVDALLPVGFVTRIEPFALPINNGQLMAVEFTMNEQG
ncbi:hypothetical protein O7635_05345 [Asanoa sp. WMMD1127]|uniref:hypothetical protein n=1 Tax=Asanoa sp. WMMD1127 TaxID=3016107 RepID=UPI0024179346|nr:hypothetical protein [Asanoa sp. WMMD1127]MDG4821277.1 hypothetical protein [Asanoa sp. WMMD1127]